MNETTLKKNLLFDLILPRLEAVGWLLAGGGLALRWFGQPGQLLLLIGLAVLSEICFLRAFAPARLPAAMWNPAGSVAAWQPLSEESFFQTALAPKLLGISEAVVLLGVLFKLMFWSGAYPALLAGSLVLAFTVLAQALRQQLDRRALVILVLGSCCLFTSSAALAARFYAHDPTQAQKVLEHLSQPSHR